MKLLFFKTYLVIMSTVFICKCANAQTKQDSLNILSLIDKEFNGKDLLENQKINLTLYKLFGYLKTTGEREPEYSKRKGAKGVKVLKANNFDLSKIDEKNFTSVFLHAFYSGDYDVIENILTAKPYESKKYDKGPKHILALCYYKQGKLKELYNNFVKMTETKKFFKGYNSVLPDYKNIFAYLTLLYGDKNSACKKFIGVKTLLYKDGRVEHSKPKYQYGYKKLQSVLDPFCKQYKDSFKPKNARPNNPFAGKRRIPSGSLFLKNSSYIEAKLNINSGQKTIKSEISPTMQIVIYKTDKAKYEILYRNDFAVEIEIIPNTKLEFSLEGDLGKVYRFFVAHLGVAAFDGLNGGKITIKNPIRKKNTIDLDYRIDNLGSYEVVNKHTSKPYIKYPFEMIVEKDNLYKKIGDDLGLDPIQVKNIFKLNAYEDYIKEFKHMLIIYPKNGYVDRVVIK